MRMEESLEKTPQMILYTHTTQMNVLTLKENDKPK